MVGTLVKHGHLLSFETETSAAADAGDRAAPDTVRTPPDRGQLLASVKSVSGLVKCGVIGLNWLRKSQQSSAVAKAARSADRPAVSDLVDRCRIWTKIVKESQKIHKPRNIMQLLPQQNTFSLHNE